MDESTRHAVLADIEKYERLGEFDRHVDPIDESISLPVDENFPYIPKGTLRLKYALERAFYVNPFIKRVNKQMLRTEIVGTENLSGLKGAIVTCNHVNKFDCLAIKYALKGKDVYVIGAKFNNMRGFMGEMMRAGGLLPLSDSMAAMKNLNRAIKQRLGEGAFVVCYPEQAMWWNYEKPRPFKDGAFSMALMNGVPILPLFITFRHSGEYDANGIEIKYMTLHIMPPIYPDKSLSHRQSVAQMKQQNYDMCKQKYQEIYAKPLSFSCDKEEE